MKIVIIKKSSLVSTLLFIVILISIFFSFQQNNILTTFFSENGEGPIRAGNSNSNKMAFTCNVDWGNEEIPKLLDVFDEKGIKITFFITGRWAANNPELLKIIYDRGHEIGNHGYSHKMHSKISKQGNYEEIKKTEDVIFNVLRIRTKYFAPPSGDYNQVTIEAARELGYSTILWSVDTIDWKEGSNSSVIIDRVMKKPHNGAILLMHPKKATVEALPTIIDKIQGDGIQIGTVSNLLQ